VQSFRDQVALLHSVIVFEAGSAPCGAAPNMNALNVGHVGHVIAGESKEESAGPTTFTDRTRRGWRSPHVTGSTELHLSLHDDA
jgi:hypothetical protein